MSLVRTATGFGDALRGWRRHRGLSQLELALKAGTSPRHLSFLETGRSSPSPQMVLRLAEALDVPLWDRNRLLVAAGFAPAYSESGLDDRGFESVREAVRMLLERHEPYPAYAMDGAWNVIDANRPHRAALEALGIDAEEGRNILRLLCAPHLLRPAVVNWDEVVAAVLRRVRRQLDAPEPPAELGGVVREIRAYPGVEALFQELGRPAPQAPFVPLTVRSGGSEMRWMTTLVTIGGALDVAVAELVVECFVPADAETERFVREARATVASS